MSARGRSVCRYALRWRTGQGGRSALRIRELLDQVVACEIEWRLKDRSETDMRTRAWRGDREEDAQA